MAVDSAEKRFSMIEFGDGSMGMMFEVDSAVDLDDRQHLLGCYSGIAFGTVSLSPELCWPLTVALVDTGRTTIAVNSWKSATVTVSDSGRTTMTKGC